MEAGKSDSDGGEGTVLRCPACRQDQEVLLILPCSDTMCAGCVSAGEAVKPGRSHLRAACTVACPGCRHPVELPCWSWSNATSCLPELPSVSPVNNNNNNNNSDNNNDNNNDITKDLQQSNMDAGGAAALGRFHGGGAVDLSEEEMEQSVLGLRFSLDPASAPPSLRLCISSLVVVYRGEDAPPSPPRSWDGGGPASSDPGFTLPGACADVTVGRGQYYWEVEVCNSSVYRVGVRSADGSGGLWLQRRGPSFSVVYDTTQEPLCTVPPWIKTIGVFLNLGGGALSFHNPLTQEHLATLPTCFPPAGVRPAVCLGQGRIRLRCGLPPPPHVFLCKDSTYRGPRGAGPGRRAGETQFQSVRKVIEKFEELAASDPEPRSRSRSGSSRPSGPRADGSLGAAQTSAAPLAGLIWGCHLKG